ncbi:MAG: hypothetical protein Kow00108_01860 [Calditrichia bacterium]
MKKVRLGIIFLLMLSYHLIGQDVFSNFNLWYNGQPTVLGSGQAGLFNPANSRFVRNVEMKLLYGRLENQPSNDKYYGMSVGFRNFTLNAIRNEIGGNKVTDYQLNLGDGNETFAWGTSIGWSAGDRGAFGRKSYFGIGGIFRPNPYISLSTSYFKPYKDNDYVAYGEVGIRPFGTDKLALSASYIKNTLNPAMDETWGAGIAVELVDGVTLFGSYFKDDKVLAGLNFSVMGFLGFNQHHGFTKDKYNYSSYELRLGGGERSWLMDKMMKDKQIVKFHLKGKVDYQKFVLFDDKTIRFKDLLDKIDAIGRSKQVKVLAINLSGFSASRELTWELREALKRIQEKGKQVVIYIDNPDLSGYYLASTADMVIMDPLGILVLNGLLYQKTYLNGMLEKIGLAVDEWRFFKYKSAYEVLSRKEMSEADSTQLQEYLNDIYAQYREDISHSRNMSEEQFDKLVNEQVLFLAQDAADHHLVDTLGRWVDIDDIIQAKMKAKYTQVHSDIVEFYENLDDRWSEEPKIAIVYGLGPCALESGINARYLEKVFSALQKDKSVKGIVFRVDSPGGDALASDLVTEAIKKVRKVKPVVVSQGYVAGSGGYWISMNSDKIYASPFTITGSIGVIGGWIYNNGLVEKLGLAADKVQVGDHADLGFGPVLPLLNMPVPYRNLDQRERTKVKSMFLTMYGQFVKKVAENRGVSEEHIRKVAEGRIYSGADGLENKLVDELGDMHAAIEEVKMLAKIKPGTPVDIVEFPKNKGLLNMNFSPFGVKNESVKNDARWYYINRIMQQPMVPFPMTPVSLWNEM